MRWLPFLILAYVSVSIQFALGGVLQWGAWTPNLVLLLVIFIGLHAPLEAALLAGCTAGFMHDVIASHGIGTYALAYTLIAGLCLQLRSIMYADHTATHFTITLLLGLILTLYMMFRSWVRNFYFTESHDVAFWPSMMGILISAVLAVPVIYALRKIRRPFAFSNK